MISLGFSESTTDKKFCPAELEQNLMVHPDETNAFV
jgi:hypothetical protein